ncbi:LamG domain-containing protein [Anaeromyxobacter oryzae]|uniref:LamG-like jellyroll fold domain-containing protein n=1 Tax=Anaeromyxobacter oryzae TaxID=2918170 RepID=A0ABM7X0V9_9BACT|nr:LamG domain-containing protein [Anaeromyxobacter oryzae]BDG05380.1 hypothetical protein AMOR_43760 [Anaeromyxobacter oryzae]
MHRPTLAALAVALALPFAAAAQAVRPGEPSRGLLASYPLDGQAVDDVTRTPAQAVGVRPMEGHDGQPRGALWFDGARSYVSLGDRLQPERFTIAAWIRPELVDRVQVIVSKIRNLPNHYQRNLELRLEPGGRLFLHVPSGNGWESVQGQRAIAPGRWTHVAAVYDGARAQLYVDGVRDGAPVAVAYAQTRTETFIGARPEGGGRDGRTPAGPTWFFTGGIEDVRIWGRPLSDAETSLVAQGRLDVPAPPPARPPPGADRGELLASYPLDGDARDAAGQADGRIVGAVKPAEDRGGDPRGALLLGGRDYVDLGVRVEPEQFTLAAWVRPARVDRDLVVLSKWSSAPGPKDRFLELRIDAGGRVTLAIPGGPGGRPQQVRSTRPLAANRWAHLAASFDGERAVLYVDGAADAEATFSAFDASQGPVLLGARPDASGKRPRLGTFFEGRLDDVRIYRGVLEDREVQALAQDRGAPPPRPGPAPGPRPGDDDEREAAFLVKLDRLQARYDAACVRRSGRSVLEAEAQVFQALEDADRAARAERNQRISGYLRRALGELQAARNRTDAMSLDRKRSALSGLSESLWNDLVQDLDATPLGDDRYDDRRGGGDVRRADPWY